MSAFSGHIYKHNYATTYADFLVSSGGLPATTSYCWEVHKLCLIISSRALQKIYVCHFEFFLIVKNKIWENFSHLNSFGIISFFPKM